MPSKKTLTVRERRFCQCYAARQNAREAAAQAGFLRPAHAGTVLLDRKDILREIGRVQRRQIRAKAVVGLERIAFGSAADAVYLAVQEEPPGKEQLEQLDLFNLAEIKWVKGGCDIKLYDRQKALECLLALAEGSGDGARQFFKALQRSVTGDSGDREQETGTDSTDLRPV